MIFLVYDCSITDKECHRDNHAPPTASTRQES